MRSATPLAFFLCVASTISAQKISTFDIPGGTNTTPTGISSAGEIVGSYTDSAAKKTRGFLRQPNGTITVFDFPNGVFTTPTAVNSGLIVGYSEQSGPLRSSEPGFLRGQNGGFASIIPPAATDVFPTAINPSGEIVGWYINTAYNRNSFIRANGSITVLTLSSIESQINAINPAGQCTGFYLEQNTGDFLGFLRQPDGSVTSFNALNATGTFPEAINARGQIAGSWRESNFPRGFMRDINGNITVIEFPGAKQTQVLGIDSSGRVAGVFSNDNVVSQAFVREVDGSFTTIEVADSTYTTVVAMNPGGEIVGAFFDAKGVHGWVRSR